MAKSITSTIAPISKAPAPQMPRLDWAAMPESLATVFLLLVVMIEVCMGTAAVMTIRRNEAPRAVMQELLAPPPAQACPAERPRQHGVRLAKNMARLEGAV